MTESNMNSFVLVYKILQSVSNASMPGLLISLEERNIIETIAHING